MASRKLTTRERFFKYVRVEVETGCWIWLGGINSGYPRFNDQQKYSKLAHIWAWVEIRGRKFIKGLDLHHVCRNPGCVNPWHRKQVSHAENMRLGRNVQVAVDGPGLLSRTVLHPIERFFALVAEQENGCWLWQGFLNDKGYGDFFVGGKERRLAHVWAFENLRGEIVDPNLDRDHLCKTPACVNPWHLEQVDHRTNMLRGDTNVAALHARKEACSKGHPFTPDNLAVSKRGYRVCKICRDEYNREYHQTRYRTDSTFRARKLARAVQQKAERRKLREET